MADDGSAMNEQSVGEMAPIYLVRLGEGHEGHYAICKQIGLVKGSTRLPGSGRTASEIADAQKLLSGKLPDVNGLGIKRHMFLAQSAEDDSDD
jgi:hypothetical protein